MAIPILIGGKPMLIGGRPVMITALVASDNQPVAEWISSAGVASGQATWTDTVGGLVLTETGAITTAASGGTNNWLVFPGTSGNYMMKSDGVGSLPVGASDRTVMFVGGFGTTGRFCGFSWGTNTAGRAFTLGTQGGSAAALSADFFNSSVSAHEVGGNGDGIFFATYRETGGEVRIYHGTRLVASEDAVVIDTGSTQINLMRPYGSGTPQAGNVGCIRVWDSILSEAERQAQIDEMMPLYLGLTTAPTATSLTFTASSATQGNITATIPRWTAGLTGVLTTSATPPSKAQIDAHTDHADAAAIPFNHSADNPDSAMSYPVISLTQGTTYYPHYYMTDAYDNLGTVQTGTQGATTGLSAPTSITPTTINLAEQTPPAVIGALAADQPSTFSKNSGASEFSISSGGVITLDTAVTAAASPYTINVKAENSVGDFDADITLNVSAASASADYTRATYALAATLIDSWGGTVPEGRDVVIEVSGGSSGDVTFQDLNPDYRVTIRPVAGTYSLSMNSNYEYTFNNPAKVTGGLMVRSCSNLTFFRGCFHKTATSTPVAAGNIEGGNGIEFINCLFSRNLFAYDIDLSAGITNDAALHLGYATGTALNCIVRNCLIMYGQTDIISIKNVDGFNIEGCVLDWSRNDEIGLMKGGTQRDGVISRNWFSHNKATSSGRHPDGVQAKGGDQFDHLYYGNFMWSSEIKPNSYIHGQQCFFLQNDQHQPGPGVGTMLRMTFDNNIVFGDQNTGIKCSVGSGGTLGGIVITNNEIGISEIGDRGDPQIKIGTGSPDANVGDGASIPFVWNNQNGTTSMHTTGQTPLVITNNFQGSPIGSVSRIPFIGATDYQMDIGGFSDGYGDYEAYIPGTAGYQGHHSGAPTSNSNDIGWLLPPDTSSVRHWNYAGTPKGAATRLEEIFVLGQHPGNAGWPVDLAWTVNYNQAGSVASNATVTLNAGTWSGSWASNGDPL
jgi:hypothetical protein